MATWAFEDFEVDELRFELRRAGARVVVEPQVLEVLTFLVANHDRIVLKDELINQVWPDGFISDATLNSRIMSARKAICDSGKEQRLIRTVHGRGYRFVGAVHLAGEGPVATPDASGEPAPQAEPAPASNLPAVPSVATTSFVGRERELSRLDELLARPGCRLVTIVGPGGVGKTRLALEAAARQRWSGNDVYFVGAETLDAAAQLPAVIARELGLTLTGSDAASQLPTQLAGREALIILDNLEQIAEGATPLLIELVHHAPGVRLLITSRTMLGLREEWLFAIGGLSLEAEAGEPSEAVSLLLEREAQSRAEISQTTVDGAAIEICRLVDGMPLALELAASLSRYLTHEQIANKIAHDIDLLQADLRNVPARHRSIPGLFEESCRHLTEEQRRALYSLAVFESSWAPEASAEVAGAPLGLLMMLVDHSLVQSREGRFALHPLMRQFSRERLGLAYEELQSRHAVYYASFLEKRRDDLQGGRQLEAIDEIAIEFANIAAAWHWSVQHRRTQLLEAMAQPVFLFLQYRARFLEGDELLRPVLAPGALPGDSADLHARLLVQSAWVRFRLGRYAEAAEAIEVASDYYTKHADHLPSGLGTDPRTALAAVFLGGGNYAEAHRLAAEAMAAALERGDRIGSAFAMWLAGHTLFRDLELEVVEGEPVLRPAESCRQAAELARSFVEGSGRILEELGETWLRSHVEIERGTLTMAFGDPRRALSFFEEAHRRSAAIRDKQGTGSALLHLADVYVSLGEIERAEELYPLIEELYRDLGDDGVISELERSKGLAAAARGDVEGAYALLSQALRRAMKIDYTINALGALGGLGNLLAEAGDDRAVDILAFIAARQETHPVNRARSAAALRALEAEFPASLVDDAREAAQSLSLEDVAAIALEASGRGDTGGLLV